MDMIIPSDGEKLRRSRPTTAQGRRPAAGAPRPAEPSCGRLLPSVPQRSSTGVALASSSNKLYHNLRMKQTTHYQSQKHDHESEVELFPLP